MHLYRDSGVPHDEADDDLVLHGMLSTPGGLVLMGADSGSRPENDTGKASLALSGDDEEELSGYYERLSAGGTIIEPLERAPWGDWFGMFVDKFGVRWMVNIAGGRE